MPGHVEGSAEVKVEIQSITIASQITPSLDNSPVPLPNWVPGINLNDGSGSKRPGVFILAGNNNKYHRTLELEVKVTPPGAFDRAILTGTLDDMEFSGTVDGSTVSVQTVKAVLTKEPVEFMWLFGDVQWTLKNDDEAQSVTLPETRMEIYWIYGYPGKMYKRGVWIEVLRTIVSQFSAAPDGCKDVVQRIVNYCHAGTGLKYDSATAASYYVDFYWGGPLNLEGFLEASLPLCNCYDQAGAVQTFLAAIGIDVDYIYMDPYGFINATGLIGRGGCNNPLFLLDTPSSELVGINSELRFGFGNHAFTILEHKNDTPRKAILDSTVGPHLGTESRRDYVRNSIDRKTKLYPQEYLERPGRIKDMNECIGITDVHSITAEDLEDADFAPCTSRDFNNKKLEDFKKLLGFDEQGIYIDTSQGIACDLPDPQECEIIKDYGWNLDSRIMRGGSEMAAVDWIFHRDYETLSIQVAVSNRGTQAARNRMLYSSFSTQGNTIPFKRRHEAQDGLAPLHIFSSDSERINILNVNLRMHSFFSMMDLLPLAKWFRDQLIKYIVENLDDHLPVIKNVEVNPVSKKIKVDEEVTITIQPDKQPYNDPLIADFFFNDQSLRLVNESAPKQDDMSGNPPGDFSYTFKGRIPGDTTVMVALINTNKLLCSQPEEVTITVS
jgi:hypothetical protein